jgi:hypothetical protein
MIDRGVRFKQIEYSGQKKIYFLPYDIYFSVNRGGARTPTDAYLRSSPEEGQSTIVVEY